MRVQVAATIVLALFGVALANPEPVFGLLNGILGGGEGGGVGGILGGTGGILDILGENGPIGQILGGQGGVLNLLTGEKGVLNGVLTSLGLPNNLVGGLLNGVLGKHGLLKCVLEAVHGILHQLQGVAYGILEKVPVVGKEVAKTLADLLHQVGCNGILSDDGLIGAALGQGSLVKSVTGLDVSVELKQVVRELKETLDPAVKNGAITLQKTKTEDHSALVEYFFGAGTAPKLFGHPALKKIVDVLVQRCHSAAAEAESVFQITLNGQAHVGVQFGLDATATGQPRRV